MGLKCLWFAILAICMILKIKPTPKIYYPFKKRAQTASTVVKLEVNLCTKVHAKWKHKAPGG